jgi:hypothetical protein
MSPKHLHCVTAQIDFTRAFHHKELGTQGPQRGKLVARSSKLAASYKEDVKQ